MIKDNVSNYDILKIKQPEIKLVVEIALMIPPSLNSINNTQSQSPHRMVMDTLAMVVHP